MLEKWELVHIAQSFALPPAHFPSRVSNQLIIHSLPSSDFTHKWKYRKGKWPVFQNLEAVLWSLCSRGYQYVSVGVKMSYLPHCRREWDGVWRGEGSLLETGSGLISLISCLMAFCCQVCEYRLLPNSDRQDSWERTDLQVRKPGFQPEHTPLCGPEPGPLSSWHQILVTK